MVIGDQYKTAVFDPSIETLPWQPNFVGFSAWVSLDAGGKWRGQAGQRWALPCI